MRYRIEYNGIISEFNVTPNGGSRTVSNGKVTSWSTKYSVRPSSSNKMDISDFYECHKEDGSVEYHFNTRRSVKKQPRGLKLIVTRIA